MKRFSKPMLKLFAEGLAELIPSMVISLARSRKEIARAYQEAMKAEAPEEIEEAFKKFYKIIADNVSKAAVEYRANKDKVKEDKKKNENPMIAISGPSCSGKTTLANAGLDTDLEARPFENTVGINLVEQTRYRDVKIYDMFGITDSKFYENFLALVEMCRLDAVIFVYSDVIANWEFLLKTIVAAKIPVIVIRNKIDQVKQEYRGEVKTIEESNALKLGASVWLPVSATSGEGVNVAYREAIRMARENYKIFCDAGPSLSKRRRT